MSEAESTSVNPVAELRQLEELIEQINKTLVAQREMLRRHRLAMPPVILDTLQTIKQDFKQLESKVLSETDRVAAVAGSFGNVDAHHHFT